MLSTPDSHLVARDPAIRGLASVLDPEAALRTFREAAPDLDLRSLTVEYLRYKPGTNCLARLSVDVAGVRTPGYAKAYADVHRPPTPRPEARAFLAKSTAIEFGLFPFDRKLESLPIASDLAWASDRTPRATAGGPRSAVVAIEPLAYKPERRFVACWHLEDGRRYVAKTYRAEDFPNVVRRAGLARSFPDLPLVRPATIREHRHTMVLPWIAGPTLDATLALAAMQDADLRATGAALARLHRESPPADFSELPSARTDVPHAETRALLAFLVPDLEPRLRDLGARRARLADPAPDGHRVCHGDFHARQVVLATNAPAILDLDEAHVGDRFEDLASFLAHLELSVLLDRLSPEGRDRAGCAFLEGYRMVLPAPDVVLLFGRIADRLLAESTTFFRLRLPDWDRRVRSAVDRAEKLVEAVSHDPAAAKPVRETIPGTATPLFGPKPRRAEVVDDEFPFLARAQDPDTVARTVLPAVAAGLGRGEARLRNLRVHRHKPGRRAVLEYSVAAGDGAAVSVCAKIRRKGIDRLHFEFLRSLIRSGFDADATDGISIPTPIAQVAELGMVVHAWVPGTSLTRNLRAANAPDLARRTANALVKLHRNRTQAPREHSLEDELEILGERLASAAARLPALRERVLDVLEGCRRVAERLSPPESQALLHRDFYPDQVLVDDSRLWIVDLDLAASGDPALDAGNFLAHVIEYALRTCGDARALDAVEHAFREQFLSRCDVSFESVHAWTTFALARHIAIGLSFEERRHLVPAIVALCEDRLAVGLYSIAAP